MLLGMSDSFLDFLNFSMLFHYVDAPRRMKDPVRFH